MEWPAQRPAAKARTPTTGDGACTCTTQERAAREVAQAQELARVKKQLAARAAAQQRLSIAQAAAAAKAAAATHLGLPVDTTATDASG
nr:hypothetical protein [Tanacetum cinerariifolium]